MVPKAKAQMYPVPSTTNAAEPLTRIRMRALWATSQENLRRPFWVNSIDPERRPFWVNSIDPEVLMTQKGIPGPHNYGSRLPDLVSTVCFCIFMGCVHACTLHACYSFTRPPALRARQYGSRGSACRP